MAVQPCPKGLREKILCRDGHSCLWCGSGRNLELHHLIVRAGCDKDLRWAPMNLATLCRACHGRVTDMKAGYKSFAISKFGNQQARLKAFWKAMGREWGISEECLDQEAVGF